MPVLLMVGAGNIGRGFIAPLFSAAGWRVRFADVDAARIAALNRRGSYRVLEVSPAGDRVCLVAPVEGVDAADTHAMAAAWADCDCAAVAVGIANLPRLAPALAAGLRRRGARPLDLLVCENGADPAGVLRAALAAQGAADAPLGLVRTAIGRMIPASRLPDPLDLAAEPWCHLPVERAAFRGAVPEIPHLEAVDDIAAVLAAKLYLHNGTHAALAYAGAVRGHATIDACMRDAGLVAAVRAAGSEVALALARRFGLDCLPMAQAMLSDLLERYRNHRLADPVARVGRDPWRKLARDDRLLGGLSLCLAQGVEPRALAALTRDGLRWHAASDEPDAARWNDLAAPAPRLAALGVPTDAPLWRLLAA